MADPFSRFTDAQILAMRPPRKVVNAQQAYLHFTEHECNAEYDPVNVATIFLTNRECPFRCLMCDLWQYTLTKTVTIGQIPEQISQALAQLSPAREIKLYNSGNFFDRKAIPPEDYSAIATLACGFETVIVENHPKLCGQACLQFRDLIAPAKLEVAIGLETCHPQVLAALNKGMTLADFDRAVCFLHCEQIRTRVFLLLNPPFIDTLDAVNWTLRSIDYAFDRGVSCCSIIPTRSGNGIMDQLQASGDFTPPTGLALEQVSEQGIAKRRGRVFVDLWDVGKFFHCDDCRERRVNRLEIMNLTQQQIKPIHCEQCNE